MQATRLRALTSPGSCQHLHSHAGQRVFRSTLHRTTHRSVASEGVNASRKPVLISVDNTQSAEDAVSWAFNTLHRQGDEFHLVHVVCDPRSLRSQTPVGIRPTGRLVVDMTPQDNSPAAQAYRDRLMAAAQAVVDQRSRVLLAAGVSTQVSLPYQPGARAAATIAQAVLAVAEETQPRMVVVANHGPGALAEFGSVARYLYQHSAPHPLLLIPDGTGPGSDSAADQEVLMVLLHVRDVEDLWRWFTESLQKPGQKVRLLVVGGRDTELVLPAGVESAMKAAGVVFEEAPGALSSMDQDSVGEQVCQMASSPSVHLVVLVDDSERSLLAESLQGSTGSYLSRHCSKPLLLLHNPGA